MKKIMADSDSDAFESADEEVVEKKEKEHHKNLNESREEKKQEEPKKSENIEKESTATKSQSNENSSEHQQQQGSSWRSWSAFGMLKSASQNVASITTQVSQSISTAIESISIPEPEELAKINAADEKDSTSEKEVESDKTPSEEGVFKFNSLLSNVTSISSKVVTGGLDTLEGIGKKTINILQETDPNIANKLRNINSSNKPNLSDILKEAKEREESAVDSDVQFKETKIQTVNLEHLLDEYKGLVYLEALEILSKQSKLKIELLIKPLTGKSLSEMEETLTEVEELCELPDSDSFDSDLSSATLEEKLRKAIEDLSIEVNFSEIVNCSKEIDKWIGLSDAATSLDIYNRSIEALAKLCALSLNNYQKLAEMLLSLGHRSTADEADSVTQLGAVYFSLFNHYAGKFSEIISTTDEGKKLSTNIFLECSNAISYVKKAFQLLIPILQLGAL